jgi:integrase
MAKTTERLSALKIANLTRPGYFADGGNLYFRIASSGARGWIFRFTVAGRTRDMGLGPYPSISLAAARKAASKYLELVKQGVDPIDRRREERANQQVALARIKTFDDCAREYMVDHERAWRSAKHREQWRTSLASYVSPVFGKLPVSAIDETLVLRALKPIWHEKTETASRVRGRVESILNWGRVNGYRSGENPARWKGNLEHSLPARAKVHHVKHHAAMPYTEAGEFLARLRKRPEVAAKALEFIILTAVRTGEALGATWDEIDFAGKTWKVPAERMKAGRDHRVPLSTDALAILETLHAVRTSDLIFPGSKGDNRLSVMAVPKVLQRMGHANVTVHGFRSTFRDWAGERTNSPREVAEMALAHAIEDKTEAAYRRGDLFDKRRKLMEAWADYCDRTSVANDVVPLRRRQNK